MRDEDNTKKQLIRQLSDLRKRLAELEEREAERRRSKHAICRMDAQLAAIIRAFDGAVSVCAQDHHIEYINEQLIKQIGYDGTGELCYKVFHDRDAVCPWCVNDLVFKGETVRFETKSPKTNRWYHFISVPVFYEDGTISKLTMTMDITDRKNTEEALKAAHGQLMDIIEFLPDATLVIDRKGKVIAWNRAIEEMTGVAKKDILGKGDYAYAVPFYGQPRPMLIDLVLNPGSEHYESYDFIEWRQKMLYAEAPKSYIRENKGVFLWGTASPLYDGNGNLIGSIESIRDVTERKEIESALRQREKTLEKKKLELEETNTALKVLLRRMEENREELEESITSNVKKMILPCIEKMRSSHLDENQRTCLGILESHLNEVLSPFLKNLSAKLTHLTPMEIQVAGLVKEGKTSKEIARLLGIAEKTVSGHRYNLRMKLGLKNEKTNLRSHLLSLK